MKHHCSHPALSEQEIGQRQVGEQVGSDVVVDEVHPVQPARQESQHFVRVVNEDVVALRTGRQAGGRLDRRRVFGQIDAVAPQAGVEQDLEGSFWLDIGKLMPVRRQPRHGNLLLLALLPAEGIVPLPGVRLEVAHRLQQAAVEVGLGEVPWHI